MTRNETCRTMITREKSVGFERHTRKCTTVVATTFTRKAADILQFIAIVLLFCCYHGNANAVDAQQLQQLEQQHTYQQQQQLQWHQQQQQQQQQQQLQQQRPHMQQNYQQYQHEMQLQQQQQQHGDTSNHEQAFHALLPITLPLKQQQQQHLPTLPPSPPQQRHKQHEVAPTPNMASNMQLLKTGTSLIVGDGQGEYYDGEGLETQPPAMRRRAGNRKRKRRPQIATADQSYWRGNVDDDTAPVNETRHALPPKRRKNGTGLPITEHDKSYRRPYATSKKEVPHDVLVATVPTTSNKNELKNILKNSGGNMSLSEILQQKNLSLDDLLKGKQNALLALQTTSVVPTTNKRRLPIGLHGPSSTAESEANEKAIYQPSTINSSENIDANSSKNKLKFPTLQRLKLFGTSSRANLSTDLASTRRRETATSTTTTTALPPITSSTTRLPVYKKRLQQRPTLKTPALLKPIPLATTAPTKDNLSPFSSTSSIYHPTEDATTVSEDDEVEATAQVDDFLINHATTRTSKPLATSSVTTTMETPLSTQLPTKSHSEIIKDNKIIYHSTTPSTTTKMTTNAKSAESTNGEADEVSSRTNYISLNKGIQEHNLKSNSIENDDALNTDNNNVTYKSDVNSSYADDDLENFFDDEISRGINFTKTKIQNMTPRIDIGIKKHEPGREKTGPTNLINAEFSDGVDDRTDLLELIEDRRSGTRLFKILEQRNMTLEELIEHRKRGSSQLHLKTVVQNEGGIFPGQKVILQDNMDIVTAFENFPHFNLMNLKSVKPDDIKTDSQGSSYFTSIIDIEPTDDAGKNTNDDAIGSEPGETSRRSEKSIGFFPSWKTLALASLSNPANKKNSGPKLNPFFFTQSNMFLDNVSQDLDADDDKLLMENTNSNGNNNNSHGPNDKHNNELRDKMKLPLLADDDTVEAIENEVARAHDLLDLELSGHGFKRSPAAAASISNQYNNNVYTNMPAGIRSAIAASAAIVLTSLATFMIIFVVFRWKQRKRRKSSYMKTYNAMKSKMPAMPINSRCSSSRNMDEMMGGISTITQSPLHQLHRQTSLLFPRHSRETSATPTERGASCGIRKHEDGSEQEKRNKKIHHHHHHHHHNNNNTASNGLGSNAGSMSSLALSLQSAQNLSSTKINPMDTMDPNSPEVQEYLFDALRKSF